MIATLTIYPAVDAANDAHSALMAYRRMMSIAAIHELTLDAKTFSSDLLEKPSETQTQDDAQTPPISREPQLPELQVLPAVKPAPSEKPPSPPVSARSPSTESTRPVASMSPPPALPSYAPNIQHVRAYRLWHYRDVPLDEICIMLRSKEKPLARGTVMYVFCLCMLLNPRSPVCSTYVIRALQINPSLPYSLDKLKSLVRQDMGSWIRHGGWITQQEPATAS